MNSIDLNSKIDFKKIIEALKLELNKNSELLLEANIDVNFIHASVLLYPLIRKIDNVLERPDFRKYDVEYRMLTIKSALEKHPSITVSLSYQQLKRQLTTIDTYLKTAPSYLDDFFKKQI
jgi:hypothetical protein